jgi:hypothetical protein
VNNPAVALSNLQMSSSRPKIEHTQVSQQNGQLHNREPEVVWRGKTWKLSVLVDQLLSFARIIHKAHLTLESAINPYKVPSAKSFNPEQSGEQKN